MKKTPKPRVLTKCVANTYAADNQRIIEFSGVTEEQGGLISFVIDEFGRMNVHVYHMGQEVRVTVAGKVVK